MTSAHKGFFAGLAIAVAAAGTAPAGAAVGDAPVHHGLAVTLDPAEHRIEVVDVLRLSGLTPDADDGGFRFVLHAGFEPEVVGQDWRLYRIQEESPAAFLGINATSATTGDELPLEVWRLVPDEGALEPVTLRYGGTMNHELATSGEEYQRSFSETPGLIDERGVFLAGASYWVPTFGDQLMNFELEVRGLIPPWDVVSQGRRVRHEVADGERITGWRSDDPTEEIYLVAGPWHEYADNAGGVEIFAFLRDDDPSLADKYLEATRRYLALYEAMLPSYPYASFALVENFWETGYGMPGFTLLGPRIIRFPWILTSSYPHELLHNWWGNSVYVDFDRGNWCEGLTAYMADHLFAEQRGEAATYRRATLKKYTDFVSSRQRLPAVEFTSRRIGRVRGGRLRQEPDALSHGPAGGRRRGVPRRHVAVLRQAPLHASLVRRHRRLRWSRVAGGDWGPVLRDLDRSRRRARLADRRPGGGGAEPAIRSCRGQLRLAAPPGPSRTSRSP